MSVVCRSLWLPVGSANFFSPMTDPDLLLHQDAGGMSGQCRSSRRELDPSYIPFLRESVLRRIVEVLPASFGYEQVGMCEFSDVRDDRTRPVSLTMTLRPASAEIGLTQAKAANEALCDAGATLVTLRVDDAGFYTFTATHDGPSTLDGQVGEALAEHIVTVFGGDFGVNRLEPSTDRRGADGAQAVRRYNGLKPGAPGGDAAEIPQTPPLGALSFHQLNVLIEGLCNQSLLPAVFFERYLQAKQWLESHRRKTSVLTNVDDFLREIMVAADAATAAGQIATLHRFITISRGSLQWIRRSVESVRRSLLDQMMAVSHRQARVIQLDLAGVGYERTPEMTGEATESQMRGYVMLVATKLPLMHTVADGAEDAAAGLAHPGLPDDLHERVGQLQALVQSWQALMDRLRISVASLETAVEHDWQERLLYEQEQARSEQEAMAEIERSHRGRPESRRMGEAAYNAVMLILTAVAVFAAIQAAERTTATTPISASVWRQAYDLWPVAVIAAVFFLLWPAIAGLRRLLQQRKPNSDTYSFEFAFRLDEQADQQRVRQYLQQHQLKKIRTETFKMIKIRRLGGCRVERISTDTTLLKVHSIAVVRLTLLRFARFEIVTEIMTRKISDSNQFFVRQCRMFGDSPIPLEPHQIAELVNELLHHTCAPLTDEFDAAAITDSINLFQKPIP